MGVGADKIRPEEVVKGFALARKGARNIASGLGFLALLWSTVVLLGGFVSVLRVKDFWYLTVLSFIMASNMVAFLDSKNGGIYMGEVHILRGMRACNEKFVSRIMFTVVVAKSILFSCLAIIFSISPHVCVVVSVMRLVQRDYGEAGGDADNKVKLDAALDIFYILVLIQSACFVYWLLLASPRTYIMVSDRCGFGNWGPDLVLRYHEATKDGCYKDDPLPDDWNLVTYAVGLLESTSPGDILLGARVLDSFIKQGIVVRQKILSSRQSIQNLIDTIDGTSNASKAIDGTSKAHASEIRERTARILAHLAGDIHTTQFPDALYCVCSLLESHKNYVEADLDEKSSRASETLEQSSHQEGVHLALMITEKTDHQQVELPRRGVDDTMMESYKKMYNMKGYIALKYPYTFVSKGTKELISQGLLILEGLTQDQDNCTAICTHQRLLSKITSPIMSDQDFHSNTYDKSWVDLLTRSLTVLRRLIISTGDGALRLRREISRNSVAVRNLMGILESGSEGVRELREQALEILTALAFDDSFRKQSFDESSKNTSITEKFIQILERILFEGEDGNAVIPNQDRLKQKRLTRKAGEALARLLAIPSTVGTTYGLNSAANGYDNLVDQPPSEDVPNMFTKVIHKILSCKTAAAADAVEEDVVGNGSATETAAQNQPPPQDAESLQHSTQETEEKSEERKLIAAMLSLTMVICTNCVVTEGDFSRAATEDAALVKKLKEIIEINQDTQPDCLRIVKLSCWVVMTICDLKPSCVKDFNEHRFEEVLSKALNTMSDLDNCMLFNGDDREVTKPVMSLSSLVKKAQGVLQRST